jgi:hypothetical protein
MDTKSDRPLKKAHLGCGETYLEGYYNVDFPQAEHTIVTIRADLYTDIRRLDFEPGTLDEVRAHHFLEHFTRAESLALLLRWRRWLAVGGRLVIETPDAEGIMRDFLATEKLDDRFALERHLLGSQEAGWAVHYDGWYEEKYRFILGAVGFEIVRVVPYGTNVSKQLNTGGGVGGLIDALVGFVPKGVRDAAGMNTLPNILCVARKTGRAVDEPAAARDILSRSLVGRERQNKKILDVWLREFERARSNVGEVAPFPSQT